MDCLATIVDFLNHRGLSCAEISDISAEHLAINRCEQEIVPVWDRDIEKNFFYVCALELGS